MRPWNDQHVAGILRPRPGRNERQQRLHTLVQMAHDWGLAVGIDAPIAFRNATDRDTRYVVALAADAAAGVGGGTIHRGIVP